MYTRWPFGIALAIAAITLAPLPARLAAQTKAAPPARQTAPAPKQAPAASTPAQREAVLAKITEKWTGDLDGMVQRRYIRVATTYNKTHYFIDQGVQRGIAYEASKLYEDELNASLKTRNLRVNSLFIPMSREELLASVVEGRADIAVAALTVTPERQKLVDFSIPTRTNIDEIVVTGPGAPPVKSLEDLSGQEVFVRTSSSYHDNLVKASEQLKSKGRKPIVLRAAPETLETDDILEMVNAGLVKITVADNYIAEFWKQLLPNIVLHPDVAVATGGVLAVAMRKGSPQLMASVNQWIKLHGPKTLFGNMMTQRYLKSTRFARSATGAAEMKRFEQTIAFFRKYGDQYEMDFLLMAAQGFQESGLDQNVTSPVGAIGVMQVMPATGKELKTGDIRLLEPNIHAGVKYMRFVVDQYYKDEPMDRLNKGLFAFASYNAGPARIARLRKEAAARGLNPNVWFNNVERIASERIGRETVTYVANIFKYYVAYTLAMDAATPQTK